MQYLVYSFISSFRQPTLIIFESLMWAGCMVGFGNTAGGCGLEQEKDKEAGSFNTTEFMGGGVSPKGCVDMHGCLMLNRRGSG